MQGDALCGAKMDFFQRFGSTIVIESVDCDTVRKRKWSPADLVDWLLEANVHIILCHPNQGCPMSWNMIALDEELQRLYDHVGFPMQEQLRCPIFRQDKISYLHAVPEITNPTLPIFLIEDHDYDICDRVRITR